ncbi:MAG: hypothetical protein MZV65_40530 [Chromatiales bacterium]|nr:hypothetical protein [Chromatiales bacterium]
MNNVRQGRLSHPHHNPGALVGIVALCMLVASPAYATVINYQNFDNLSNFTLNGSAATINTGGQGVIGPDGARVLRLTNDLTQAGSAFLTSPFSLAADASFSSYFEFQFTDQQNTGADGIVFTLQTVANTAGGYGAGIGYEVPSPQYRRRVRQLGQRIQRRLQWQPRRHQHQRQHELGGTCRHPTRATRTADQCSMPGSTTTAQTISSRFASRSTAIAPLWR